MVEVAISLPFLLVMILIAAEFSRAFYEYNTLTKGVRDAARLVAEDAYSNTNQFELSAAKVTAAKNLVVYGNISGGGAPVLKELGLADVNIVQRDLGSAPTVREHIEVTATYDFQPLSTVIPGAGFLPGDVGIGFTLVASSTMRGL